MPDAELVLWFFKEKGNNEWLTGTVLEKLIVALLPKKFPCFM
jgi:hypothetical protein